MTEEQAIVNHNNLLKYSVGILGTKDHPSKFELFMIEWIELYKEQAASASTEEEWREYHNTIECLKGVVGAIQSYEQAYITKVKEEEANERTGNSGRSQE